MRDKVKNIEIVSLNRKKEEIVKEKAAKGGITASSWYLRGRTERVIYCQPSPGGKLASNIKKAVNSVSRNGAKTLVVEDGGTPITASLRQNDSFRKHECRFGDKLCMVESSKDCAMMNAIYMK